MVPLRAGHVITNEPGYCASFRESSWVLADFTRADKENHWGIRIESALVVQRVEVCEFFQCE